MPRQRITSRLADAQPKSPRDIRVAFTLDSTTGLTSPLDVVIDPTGRLVVLDAAGPDLIAFDVDGRARHRWPVSGTTDRPFFRPLFLGISGLSLLLLDPDERVILRFDLRGQYQGEALDLSEPSLARRLGFFEPADFIADKSGRLFISDRDGHRVLVFDPTGELVTIFGGYGTGAGQFRHPTALAVDEAGLLYVADTGNRRVQVFDGFGAYLRAVRLPEGGPASGGAPIAIQVSPDGTLLAADDQGSVVALSASGGLRFRSAVGGVRGIAIHPTGRAFLLQKAQGRIIAVDPEVR